MKFSYTEASIAISPDWDIRTIVLSAGGNPDDPGSSVLRDGILTVFSVSQSDLDAALAVYDHAVIVNGQAWSVLRAERDRRLASCDWTQATDSPLSADLQAAWKEYRKLLRDVPVTTTDPLHPLWPEAPA